MINNKRWETVSVRVGIIKTSCRLRLNFVQYTLRFSGVYWVKNDIKTTYTAYLTLYINTNNELCVDKHILNPSRETCVSSLLLPCGLPHISTPVQFKAKTNCNMVVHGALHGLKNFCVQVCYMIRRRQVIHMFIGKVQSSLKD